MVPHVLTDPTRMTDISDEDDEEDDYDEDDEGMYGGAYDGKTAHSLSPNQT